MVCAIGCSEPHRRSLDTGLSYVYFLDDDLDLRAILPPSPPRSYYVVCQDSFGLITCVRKYYKIDKAIPFPLISNLPILSSTSKARPFRQIPSYSGFIDPLLW